MSTSDSSFRSHSRLRRQQGSSLTFPLAILAIGSVAGLAFVIMLSVSPSTDPHHEAITDREATARNEATGQSVPSNAAAAAGGAARLDTSDSARGDSGSAANAGADSDDVVFATGDNFDSNSDSNSGSNSEGTARTRLEANRRGFGDASSAGLDLRTDRTRDPAGRDAALPAFRGGSSSAANTATESASDAVTDVESAANEFKRRQEATPFGSDIYHRIIAVDGQTITNYGDIASIQRDKGPDGTIDITYERYDGEIVTETTPTLFCCNDAADWR